MGLKDTIKSQLSKQEDKHGHKVTKGMTKAADVVSKKAAKSRETEGGDNSSAEETSTAGSSADQMSSADQSGDEMGATNQGSDEMSGGAIGEAGEGPKGPLP